MVSPEPITALDEQVGRLRSELVKLGIADATMLWFCSDNGPEGKAGVALVRRARSGVESVTCGKAASAFLACWNGLTW